MPAQFIGITMFIHLIGGLVVWVKSRSFFVSLTSFFSLEAKGVRSLVLPILPLTPIDDYLDLGKWKGRKIEENKKILAVLIPAYNEEEVIARTIKSVAEAGISLKDTYVIDNCSTDRTSEVARRLGVRVLKISEKGKARAIRAGLAYFKLVQKYNWVQIVDADSAFSPDYFKEISKHFNRPEVAAICGQVKSYRHNLIGKFRAFEYTITHDIYRYVQSHFNIVNVIPGPASCFNAAIFKKINFESDTLTEDMDFTVAIHRHRLGKIIYCSRAVVTTQDPLNVRDYYRQVRRWYSGLFQVIRKRRVGTRLQRIDAEISILTLEGLWFSLFFLAMPLIALFNHHFLPYFALFIFLDSLSFLVLLTYAAVRSRSFKILFYSPSFYIFRYINAFTLIQSFIMVFLFHYSGSWNKVGREAIVS